MIAALVTLILTLVLTLNKDGTLKDISIEGSPDIGPVPRVGGMGIMAGILSGWMTLLHELQLWIVLPMLALFALSMIDDMRGVSTKTRLAGHALAAAVVVIALGLAWFWWIPALLFIVWMSNLYGRMDEVDGLGSGMAMFGFTVYGFAALKSGMAGGEIFAMMCFTIGAAGMGFLYYNFHPAKVLMGSPGTVPLGFMAAVFGLLGYKNGYWPMWFPLLVFSPFLLDATATLLLRMTKSGQTSLSNRMHYYQRLMSSGWQQQNIAILEYALMFCAGITALWGIGQDAASQANLLALWGGIYLAISMWIDRCYVKKVSEDAV